MGFPVQATDIIKQIGVTGASRVIDKFADGWFLNAIQNGYGVATDVKTMAEGNFEEGFNNLAGKFKNLILKFALGEKGKATQETTETAQEAQEINTKGQEVSTNLKNNASSIQSEVQQEVNVIENANKKVEKTQAEAKEEQEKIKEIADQITQLQKQLSATNNKEEQANLLGQIQNLRNEISSLNTSTIKKQDVVEDLENVVEDSQQNIEVANNEMTEITENTTTEITELTTQTKEVTNDITKTAADGAKNATTSAEAATAGTVASSNVVTASFATKLFKVSTDQGTASGIRLGSIAGNIGLASQAIGMITEVTDSLTSTNLSFENLIGGYNYKIGSWTSLVVPTITSIGSADAVTGAIEELNKYIKFDLNTIENSENNDATSAQETESFDFMVEQEKGFKENNVLAQEYTPTQNDLVTPTYDNKKISRSFGI